MERLDKVLSRGIIMVVIGRMLVMVEFIHKPAYHL